MSLPMLAIVKSVSLFVLAALCEIGGGYLVWQWLRNGRGVAVGVLGGIVLFLYGVIPTLQPWHFSRVYAAYELAMFVVLSLAWGWISRGRSPTVSIYGARFSASPGVGVIMYAPRS